MKVITLALILISLLLMGVTVAIGKEIADMPPKAGDTRPKVTTPKKQTPKTPTTVPQGGAYFQSEKMDKPKKQPAQPQTWLQQAQAFLSSLGSNVPIGGTPSPYQTFKPPTNMVYNQKLPINGQPAFVPPTAPITMPTTPPPITVPKWIQNAGAAINRYGNRNVPVGGTPSPMQPAANIINRPVQQPGSYFEAEKGTPAPAGGTQLTQAMANAAANLQPAAPANEPWVPGWAQGPNPQPPGGGSYPGRKDVALRDYYAYLQAIMQANDSSDGFGTQYGSNWRRRGGGGYGGGGGYTPGAYNASDFFPAAYLNLFSWNVGE